MDANYWNIKETENIIIQYNQNSYINKVKITHHKLTSHIK